jgi:RHS repeat-associated protein
VTFNYDQSSALGVTLINTKGRKSSESTAGPNATGSVFSYDQMGRVANNSQCTPQNCGTGVFAFQYTQYDSVGDLISATNAAGVTFNYAYNNAARLTGISTNFIDGSHPGTLFSNPQYSPFGTLTSATLGNGVTESWSYNNRLWQQSRTATFGATTPYSFSVATFAPNGDILAGNDSVNGNWSYSYDPFNRLLSANTTGQAYTYDYDRYGNRWHQNGPHSSQLGFDANNHITGVTGVGYDLAGNLTSDGSGPGSYNYFYDAENRIIQVGGTLGACSTATACYVYDAEGQRVRKTTGGSSMDYLYDLAGHEVADVDPTGVFMQGELYAGDRHFAIYAPNPGPTGATFFPHGDWLGTERVRTDMTGANCESIASLPFGDGQSITGTCGDVSPMHFTGDERDSETGLDHTWFRQYSSSLGRWMTPDPADLAAVDPSNPQSWNRYAYVANQPIDSTDPSGLDRICADPKIRALCTSSQVVGNPLSSLIWDEFALVELALSPATAIGLETVNMYSDTGDLLSSTSSDILSYPSFSAAALLGQGGGNSSWTWTFVRTFFTTLPSTGPGSCIDVALSAMKGPLTTAGNVAKNIAKYAAPVAPTLPIGSAWLGSQISRMVAAGAAEGEALGDAAMLATIATAASEAAPTVMRAVPYVAAGAMEGVAAYGVIQEARAAAAGKCHP